MGSCLLCSQEKSVWWRAWWEQSLMRQIFNCNADPVSLTQQRFRTTSLFIHLGHKHLMNATTLHIILTHGDTTQNSLCMPIQHTSPEHNTTTRTFTENNKTKHIRTTTVSWALQNSIPLLFAPSSARCSIIHDIEGLKSLEAHELPNVC